MANSYFQFKQFIIHQDQCAMKVGTDGVLLGSWVDIPENGKVLDVGCGTGILSLMIAQRSKNTIIEGIEIDPSAANQALENKNISKWSNQITIESANFFEWSKKGTNKYDLIICNPPFYNEGPKSSSISRDKARSNTMFKLSDFITTSKKIITHIGSIAIIIPFNQQADLNTYSLENSLYLKRICYLYPTPSKPCHRIMVQLSTIKSTIKEEHIIIESNGRHQYSEEYKNLTKEFYTAF